MNIKTGSFFFCLLLIILGFLPACGQSDREVSQALEQLSQTGSVYVDDVNTASKLTGYTVKTVSFLPEGFKLGEFPGGPFQVFKLGGPEVTTDNKYPYSVLQYFYQAGKVISNEPYFSIHQSRNKISSPADEPITINGFQGKKGIFSLANREMMYLTWNDGTTYFVIESWLTEILDDATLIKVAGSIK